LPSRYAMFELAAAAAADCRLRRRFLRPTLMRAAITPMRRYLRFRCRGALR
jgi:hypothetical protein